MTNEPRRTKPKPYESLPTVLTFSLTGSDVHALDVETLPVPNNGTPA